MLDAGLVLLKQYNVASGADAAWRVQANGWIMAACGNVCAHAACSCASEDCANCGNTCCRGRELYCAIDLALRQAAQQFSDAQTLDSDSDADAPSDGDSDGEEPLRAPRSGSGSDTEAEEAAAPLPATARRSAKSSRRDRCPATLLATPAAPAPPPSPPAAGAAAAAAIDLIALSEAADEAQAAAGVEDCVRLAHRSCNCLIRANGDHHVHLRVAVECVNPHAASNCPWSYPFVQELQATQGERL
jgi:hypothetical protein